MRICPTASSEFFGLAAPEFPGAAIVMLRFRAEKSPPPEGSREKAREKRRGAARSCGRGEERGEERKEEKRGRRAEDSGEKKRQDFVRAQKNCARTNFLLDKRVKKVI